MTADSSPLMTVAEVAERLNVSRRTVRRLFERRELRGVRIGGQWRARAEDVERMATPSPIPEEAVAAVAAAVAQHFGSPLAGTSMRIVGVRPSWESETKEAVSSAARRSGSARKGKRLGAVTQSR